jgi:DNA polymerase-4
MVRPITIRSWPRAIAHVDADAFFASVEQAVHPELKGRPVITGAERGIVAAASYEAKARGVKRGVPLHQVKEVCPECVLLPSDYETYSLYSKRIFAILRRFTPVVEEYSIDEAFCDLTGLRRLYRTNYRGIAARMKEEVGRELDITVSIGVSLSKSLAKLCSKLRKPNGLAAVDGRHIHVLLARTSLPEVWGFGPNSVALLKKHGLKNALDFVLKPERFASKLMGKVGRELWAELRGECVYEVSAEAQGKQMSISKTKTFTPPSSERDYVWARALRNLESACIKVRRHDLVARGVSLYLRSQTYDHAAKDAKLARPTSSTNELAAVLVGLFDDIYRPGVLYRATGVVLFELAERTPSQFTLFEDAGQVTANERLFEAVDEAAERFGKHAVFFADCARLGHQHSGERGRTSQRKADLLDGENFRQHLGMPLLRHKL